jgi:hypothetical protein
LSFFLTGGFLVFLYTIGCYQNWDGISSFGNRFFVSLTPLFVVGLASFFGWIASKWSERRATAFAWSVTALFVLWNMGLIFQWGTHLMPARGRVNWRDVAYNQVAVVPAQSVRTVKAYLTRRGRLMEHLEEQDMQQLREQNKKPSNPPPSEDNE